MSAILWSFKFSTSTSFTIEVGAGYFRFFTNQLPVEVAGNPYEISNPYATSHLEELQYEQINDVVYITHPSYPTYKLTRVADDNWTAAEVEWNEPAFLEENLTDVTITPSGTTGSITLTASNYLFDADHVGSYWRIGHRVPSSQTWNYLFEAMSGSTILAVYGKWNLRTYGNWSADITLEEMEADNLTVKRVVRIISGRGSVANGGDRNVDIEGEHTEATLGRYRYRTTNVTDIGDHEARVVFEAVDSVVYGFAKITAVASQLSATATVVNELVTTTATKLWAEGAWSAYRGYPRTVVLHEQRLCLGGTAHQPDTIWGSVTGDFENFEAGTNDDDAFAFQLGATESNAIQWLVSNTVLLAGTAGSEWRVLGDLNGSPITPTRVDVKQQSKYGSAYVRAIVAGGAVLFVERKGRKLRELTYAYENERWVANDLTLLAEHLFSGGIKQLAWQNDQMILWVVTGDGYLRGLTYNREQNVIGWHAHETTGTVQSVAAIYGDEDAEDEVWLLVTRTIGSTDTDFVELMEPTLWTNKVDYYGVDSGATYSGSPVTAFSALLPHLAGESVDVLVNSGIVYQGITVEPDGTVTLPEGAAAVTKAHVGLPFTSTLKPYRFDADAALGLTHGKVKQIDSVVARVYRSAGATYTGADGVAKPLELPEQSQGADESNNPTMAGATYPEDIPLDYCSGHSADPSLTITQSKPLPLSIVSLAVGYKVGSSPT